MKKLLFILLLALVYFVYDTASDAGAFRTINNHFDGEQIEIYNRVAGPEDLDIDYGTGLIFISSSDRWALRKGGSPKGGIYKIQADSGHELVAIFNTYPFDFQPHGISLLNVDSIRYLFAVNHNERGNFIEKFKYQNDTLIHIKSFESELMCCPNDVVAISENQFYVTNDHGYARGFMRKLEDYLKLPKSYVLYFDGGEFRKVYEGLNYANGINISNDARQLYVTHTTGRELLIFDILNEGDLALTDRIPLGTGLDNIEVDPTGKIWMAAHPKLFDFVAHAGNPEQKSPSQVLTVELLTDDRIVVEEIFMDDGKKISGSSVAVPYKNDIFIGVVFENKIFRGRLN